MSEEMLEDFKLLERYAKDKDYVRLRYLLYSKDLSIYDQDKKNLLMYACEYKIPIHYIKILLDLGINPNEADTLIEFTPLMYATKSNYIDAVKMLLKYGANPNIYNVNGISAYSIAENYGFYEILNVLKNYDKQNFKNIIIEERVLNRNLKQELLKWELYAEEIKNKEIASKIRECIVQGDINYIENNRENLLLLSCYHEFPIEFISLLLKNNANPNEQNGLGHTALIMATCRNNYEIVSLLIDYGANPYIKNLKGLSAYDYAKSLGFYEILSLFENIDKDNYKLDKSKITGIYLKLM